jgi:hypothetical protein
MNEHARTSPVRQYALYRSLLGRTVNLPKYNVDKTRFIGLEVCAIGK